VGTAASVTVSLTSGQKVLVTLYTSCENTNANKGCYMSVSSTGGLVLTAGDTFMAGGGATVAGIPEGASASQVFTATSTASTTFTAEYGADANTGTFHTSTIIVHIF